MLLTRILVAALVEVAAEATTALVMLPLKEPACARVLKVITFIDATVGDVVLAVEEPEANQLLLLAR